MGGGRIAARLEQNASALFPPCKASMAQMAEDDRCIARIRIRCNFPTPERSVYMPMAG